MGEYQEEGEGNQLEPQWDQIQGGGKDGEVFAWAVLPRKAELLVGQRPPEQPRPLAGAAEVLPRCPAAAWTHCTAPHQHRRAGVCGNTSRNPAEIS